MKALPSVTLVAYDTVDANRSSRVLTHCSRMFKFADAVLVTHQNPTIPYQHRVKLVAPSGYAGAMRWELEGLADAFETEHSLYVSHDGWILDPLLWNDQWLSYDFIGAPWPVAWGVGSSRRVGNSGFCLRTRRFTLAAKQSVYFWCQQPPDAFACRIMHQPFKEMGLKYAPVEVAGRFSWETYIEEGDCGPGCSFGFHGWTAGKTAANYEKLLQTGNG